jgi:ribosomal protein S10
MHFNKIKIQDTWEEMGKEINRPIDMCKKENGELTVISPTEENEDEKKQWNRKR